MINSNGQCKKQRPVKKLLWTSSTSVILFALVMSSTIKRTLGQTERIVGRDTAHYNPTERYSHIHRSSGDGELPDGSSGDDEFLVGSSGDGEIFDGYPGYDDEEWSLDDPQPIYVTDNGTDVAKIVNTGPWGNWSNSSQCSRSCGGGVAYHTRVCSVPGESVCGGPAVRYYSCNTHPCSDRNLNFRAEQCSAQNNVSFEGRFHTWLPYTNAPNLCELNCQAQGERFYYRHKRKVIDGTECGDDGVCVNGTCLLVGCDRVLGSPKRRDMCRVCGGDGSSCISIVQFGPNDLQVGSNVSCAEGINSTDDGNNTNCVDKNGCPHNPCLNGGTCLSLEPPLQSHWFCECPPEYRGNACEHNQEGSSPPLIIKQPPTEELLFQVKQCGNENDKPFTIECEAIGNPTPVYKWTKNGKDFNWQSDGERITQNEGTGTLVFNSPKSQDAGQYQCFASNKWGTASTNSVFMRKTVLESFKDKDLTATLTAEEGGPFKLTCSPPGGWPKPHISWVVQSSGGDVKSIDSPRLTVDPEGTLWFSNVTRDDITSGYLYACAAYSELTSEMKLGNKRFLNISQSSGEPSMKLHEPVVQYVTKERTMAIQGSIVSLWCIIGGTPLPTIKWTRKGELIKEGGRIKLENYNKTLKIENVGLGDQGSYYECHWSFTNSSGAKRNDSRSMEIMIYAVPHFTVEPQLQYPDKGDTVEIRCEADGSPSPHLTWIHNGQAVDVDTVDPNPRRSVSRNVIVIENVTKADTSNYGCNASNEYGYVYKDVFINVVSPDDDDEDPTAPEDSPEIIVICLSVVLSVVFALLILALFLIRKYHRKASVGQNEMETFLNGDPSADEKDGAYKMPYDKDRYEINEKSFSLDKDGVLGSGEFGRVCKGKITVNSVETAVAIKTANPQKASKTILTGLLSEIKVLAYVGKHVNITELLGANTSAAKVGKVYIFLELCPMGSLEKHLRKLRPEMVINDSEENTDGDAEDIYGNTMEMSSMSMRPLDLSLSQDLHRWTREICNGMSFLATKHVVHADLATRNVLLNANKEAKICDFGLSRRMYNYASYVKSQQEPLPWKWMAPESLRVQEFNEKTDIWAFGVTLWEMYSLGDSPYQGMSWDANFANMLERGFRLSEPQFNDRDMYSVMKQCWTINPDWRPNFAELAAGFAEAEI